MPPHDARRARRLLLWLSLLDAIAVLGSYAPGLILNPLTRGAESVGVPEALRSFYTLAMLLAAAGYLAFSSFCSAGSLGLIAAVATAAPNRSPGARRFALAGTLVLALQTAVLAALIWPAYFPVQGG